jgi:hypothetical protein
VPQYRRRTFMTAEDCAQVNNVQTDLSFLAEPSCSCLIFNNNNQSPRRLEYWFAARSNCRRLLWLVLSPHIGSALTAAPASARKYLVSKYLVKRVARSSDAKWSEASS